LARTRGGSGFRAGGVPRGSRVTFEKDVAMRSRELPADGRTFAVERTSADAAIVARFVELMQQHHDLDYMICALSQQTAYDELLVARLKKRKLQLKDEIVRVAGLIDPEGDAVAHP